MRDGIIPWDRCAPSVLASLGQLPRLRRGSTLQLGGPTSRRYSASAMPAMVSLFFRYSNSSHQVPSALL
jgi:hypothetical protein